MVLQVRYGQDKPAAGLQYAEYLPGDPQGIGGMLDDMPAGHNVEGIGGKASIPEFPMHHRETDRKSTRLNSSHLVISYAVFCLKKKKIQLCSPSFDSSTSCMQL